jgi:hypothetical protein
LGLVHRGTRPSRLRWPGPQAKIGDHRSPLTTRVHQSILASRQRGARGGVATERGCVMGSRIRGVGGAGDHWSGLAAVRCSAAEKKSVVEQTSGLPFFGSERDSGAQGNSRWGQQGRGWTGDGRRQWSMRRKTMVWKACSSRVIGLGHELVGGAPRRGDAGSPVGQLRR